MSARCMAAQANVSTANVKRAKLAAGAKTGRLVSAKEYGSVAEWLNAPVLKTGSGASHS